MPMRRNKAFIFINVDWYFLLHWVDRGNILKDLGATVTIATRITSDENKATLESLGFNVLPWPITRRSTFVPITIFELLFTLYIIVRYRPDFVHSITIKPNIFLLAALFLSKKPHLISVPGLGITAIRIKKSPLLKAISRIFSRLFINNRKYKEIVCENSSDKDFLIGEIGIPSEQIKCIPGAGININEYNCSNKDSADTKVLSNIGPHTLVGLHAARLIRPKGLIDAVSAIERIKGVEVKLLVAGIDDNDSKLSLSYKEIKRIKESPVVIWLGHRKDIKNLLHISHFSIYPTTYSEGIPRFLIESCAMSRPILVYNYPGVCDVVKNNENGFVVEPGKIEELSKKVITMQDQNQRSEFGKKGRELSKRRFDNRLILLSFKEIYKSLLQL